MSLLTLPPAMLRESFNHPNETPSHGGGTERMLALAVGIASFFAAAVVVFT
ncbi:MAG: hypothetical protein H7Y33_13695 [Cytophagales bacterium]|nr:hypothetical protein [Rhizobacter sp.]